MKFLDYNGNGGFDPQDITTSVAVEEAGREEAKLEETKREEEAENASSARPLSENAGCATMAAFMALPIIVILIFL